MDDSGSWSETSSPDASLQLPGCLPLENHDIVLESATLEYKSQSHSVNGTLTQIKDGSQESEVKVHHKEMEVQTLPYIQSNEKKNTGCQDIISAVHYDIKETAVQSSSKKGKTQDSAVQTVNFDLDGTDVNINGVKELEQAQDTSLADSSVISKSSQPINQNQELSGNELEEKALDLSSGETPCSIESVHTLQNTHANITESMINSPSKSYQSYIKDSEPKPKPSNEITRDYLPKVGMTTYKIVPQRSFEIERHDLEFTQDDRNQDTMSEPNKRLPSPASAKSLSPVRLAREAFFSELSSAVKNGSHSPQQRTHVNPLSPISQNISLIHPKEHTDLSKMSDAPDLKSDKPGITRTKSNQIAPGSVKAPSSFYLQMQRRASSMYVTSAAAKMSKSLTSPTNNETAVRSNTICINGRSGMSNLVLPEGQEFAKQ
ncbi:hypothetical protein GDO86_016866 [Hymenochirus boettgeri]|uniref:Uncharacterized protein n=1 Tax=Hymenochirus boettgeri TaxID=247094 RepID=A0A8T2IQE9_9PIPI|nr:hypothetical protein GDO86_016866 [Hymenochirus boettgeri]